MPGGGGMGRPLGPRGGRAPGGGGTGLPEGLSGGRGERWGAGGAAVSGACRGGCRGWPGRAPTQAADGPAPGAGAAAGAAAAGAGAEVGRLLIRREGRAGASDIGRTADAEAAAGGGAADLARRGLLGRGRRSRRRARCGRDGLLAGAVVAGGCGVGPHRYRLGPTKPTFAALAALAAFLAGAGSSGWTGRRNPSASALRRTRSACASSMEDEWLLTPIPRERASSSPSLLVRPSSLASS